MQIEVVIATSEGLKTYQFNDVDTCEYDIDVDLLSVSSEDGEVLAEFKDWTYWRKTGD